MWSKINTTHHPELLNLSVIILSYCREAFLQELVRADGKMEGIKCRAILEENLLDGKGSAWSRTPTVNMQPELQLNGLDKSVFNGPVKVLT